MKPLKDLSITQLLSKLEALGVKWVNTTSRKASLIELITKLEGQKEMQPEDARYATKLLKFRGIYESIAQLVSLCRYLEISLTNKDLEDVTSLMERIKTIATKRFFPDQPMRLNLTYCNYANYLGSAGDRNQILEHTLDVPVPCIMNDMIRKQGYYEPLPEHPQHFKGIYLCCAIKDYPLSVEHILGLSVEELEKKDIATLHRFVAKLGFALNSQTLNDRVAIFKRLKDIMDISVKDTSVINKPNTGDKVTLTAGTPPLDALGHVISIKLYPGDVCTVISHYPSIGYYCYLVECQKGRYCVSFEVDAQNIVTIPTETQRPLKGDTVTMQPGATVPCRQFNSTRWLVSGDVATVLSHYPGQCGEVYMLEMDDLQFLALESDIMFTPAPSKGTLLPVCKRVGVL